MSVFIICKISTWGLWSDISQKEKVKKMEKKKSVIHEEVRFCRKVKIFKLIKCCYIIAQI